MPDLNVVRTTPLNKAGTIVFEVVLHDNLYIPLVHHKPSGTVFNGISGAMKRTSEVIENCPWRFLTLEEAVDHFSIHMHEPLDLNLPLIEAVANQIEALPHRFDMCAYITGAHRGDDTDTGMSLAEANVSCGTTGCIAGWAMMLDSQLANMIVRHDMGFFSIAAKALGMTHAEADILFFRGEWPDKYRAMDDEEGAVCMLRRIVRDGNTDFLFDVGNTVSFFAFDDANRVSP